MLEISFDSNLEETLIHRRLTPRRCWRVAAECPATIVLYLTVHLFLKNDECEEINYRQWQGILQFVQISAEPEIEPGT